MPKNPDKVTRFSAALFDDAAAEGRRQSRSAAQQLDYWARLGRAVSSATSESQTRVTEALGGRLPLIELNVAEGIAFDARVTVAIDDLLASTDYGDELAAEGVTTVALENGELVQRFPDGSKAVLDTVKTLSH